MKAAQMGHHECVSILMTNGADVNTIDMVSAWIVYDVWIELA